MSKFSLLKQIDENVKEQKQLEEAIAAQDQAIREAFDQLAGEGEGKALYEAATHVLANIAAMASAGQPIKAMNAGVLASFLAGVEHIANLMPKANEEQRANALRVLQAASIGQNGLITPEVSKIAALGAKQTELAMRYGETVRQYINSVNAQQPDGNPLAQVARHLQMTLDRAMRGGVKPSEDLPAKVSNTIQQFNRKAA